jgi:hypothetical protein
VCERDRGQTRRRALPERRREGKQAAERRARTAATASIAAEHYAAISRLATLTTFSAYEVIGRLQMGAGCLDDGA